MIHCPQDVLALFPIRKSRKQKEAFREDIQTYVANLGYECTFEKTSFAGRNIVIGNPRRARYLVTAHYDTCAHLPFPNLLTPCNFWGFLGYQLLIVAVFLVAMVVSENLIYLLTHDWGLAGTAANALLLVLVVMMLIGPANRHNANDNTSGVVTVLEIAASMPEAERQQVCFVLFDYEEAGLLGSSSYRNRHRQEINNQIVLNLDCVGDGDEIVLFPTKKTRSDAAKMKNLQKLCCKDGKKSIYVCPKGFAIYPSDQVNFPYGVGIAAFHRSPWAGLYLGRIHTNRDTILEEENVNILRDRLVDLISDTAAE